MNDPILDTLTQRLDLLERQNRCWAAIAGAVTLVLAVRVLTLDAQSQPITVTIGGTDRGSRADGLLRA